MGGHQGSGKQMYSWVHIEDVCRAIDFVSDYKQLEGVYNLSAPNPVSNKCFMATLRKVTGTSVGLPAFSWMLAIGAAVRYRSRVNFKKPLGHSHKIIRGRVCF